jgi:hypothetical protein
VQNDRSIEGLVAIAVFFGSDGERIDRVKVYREGSAQVE